MKQWNINQYRVVDVMGNQFSIDMWTTKALKRIDKRLKTYTATTKDDYDYR